MEDHPRVRQHTFLSVHVIRVLFVQRKLKHKTELKQHIRDVREQFIAPHSGFAPRYSGEAPVILERGESVSYYLSTTRAVSPLSTLDDRHTPARQHLNKPCNIPVSKFLAGCFDA